MTLPNSNLNEFSVQLTKQPGSAGRPSPNLPETTCGHHISNLIKEISAPAIREIVGNVFEDLLRLLECLSLSEGHLRQADAASETFALFQIIHDEAHALVKFISEEALTCKAINEELSETLDGITFAINHDLQRVFENQQRTQKTSDQVVVGQMFRAHDLLTNCLQQSTISLAIIFNRDLDGTKLFDNSDMRYRQSLQLCEDLSELLQLGTACTGNQEEPAFAKFAERAELFRNQSLEYLMYSDWPQFESFCERLRHTETPEFELVLHQFQCYLETLLGQIRMRAVLAGVFPIQYGTQPTDSRSNSPQPYSATQDHDESEAWDPFAIAV